MMSSFKPIIKLRSADFSDAENIARLHIRSWQEHYRGIWLDDFLDKIVPEKQLALWQKRLTDTTPEVEKENKNQHVIVAEFKNELVGFACTFLKEEPIITGYLDNIHVRTNLQGLGIGQKLMKSSAARIHTLKPDAGYYLWVLESNLKSRAFYKKCGAKEIEKIREDDPVMGSFTLVKCFWERAEHVLK